MTKIARKPPSGAPEGTVWFGGPVDRFKITLRIFGDDLDPDHITSLLQCTPTAAETKGKPIHIPGGATRIPKKCRWSLTIESKDCPEGDVEDGIKTLLGRMPDDPEVWATLTSTYSVDLFCGLFLAAHNRGFELSEGLSRMLSDRRLQIGFDIYFDSSDEANEKARD
jgi:hypothetical protein